MAATVLSLSTSPPMSDGRGLSQSCDICNKGFCSGKSLGGHMRVHYQVSTKVTRHSLIKKNPTDNGKRCCVGNNKESSEVPICGTCGKDFPSMKALYGHMRSHPERPWRGMRPPISIPAPKSSSPSSSTADDRQIDSAAAHTRDCSRSLTSWSVTARRGRKSNNAASTTCVVVSGSEEKIHDAAHDVMLPAKTDDSVTKSDDLDRKKRKADEVGDAISGDSDLGMSKRKTDQIKDVLIKTETAEQGSCDSEMGRKLSRVRETEELGKLKLPDLKIAPKNHQMHLKYRCNICNKAFPTHQALGGHKSSHNKPKKIQASLALQKSSGFDPAMSEDGDCGKLATPPARETGCTETQAREAAGGAETFNMTITTCHQGMEGCKGGNSIGTLEAQSSQGTSTGESSQSGRRVLHIDLNELPPMEEGEGIEFCFSYQQQANS